MVVKEGDPPPPAPRDPFEEGSEELTKLLAGKLNPTGESRLMYSKWLLMAQVPGKPDPENPRKRISREKDREVLMNELADKYQAEDFSSSLLAVIGDHLKDSGFKEGNNGKVEKSVTFYNRLMQFFPKSDYLDFAAVGLGDVAFSQKNYKEAADKYRLAKEKLPGIKYPNALIGLAKSLIEEKQFGSETKDMLKEVTDVKEWKGPLHAEAFYLMGECDRLQGNWAPATTSFGRLFLSFAKFEEWALKGYLGAEFCHRASGQNNAADNTLKEAAEYLAKKKITDGPLMNLLRARAKERAYNLP